jgi:hypothetical protein
MALPFVAIEAPRPLWPIPDQAGRTFGFLGAGIGTGEPVFAKPICPSASPSIKAA